MRKIASTLFFFPLLAAAPFAVWACSSDDSSNNTAADSGIDATASEAGDERVVLPPVDASTRHCTLDNGADPVNLCLQKAVLAATRDAALLGDAGAASSWNSKTFAPDTDDGGAPRHGYADDLAFGAAIAGYHFAAELYGDTEITEPLNQALVSLANAIESELAMTPADYDGFTYSRLRAIAGRLRVINENTHADAIDKIADSYGKALSTTFAKTVAAQSDGGASGLVLGTDAGNGQIAYRPASAISGAFALIDMANRHQTDDDAGAQVYASSAMRIVDYVYTRARDPQTGMYYAALVTSSDPGHDALASGATPYPDDALVADVQAQIALTLSRISSFIKSSTAAPVKSIASYPFLTHAEELESAMNGGTKAAPPPTDGGDAGAGAGVSLWDSMDRGYFEAYVPSTQTLITNKPTLANAYMFAMLHRRFYDDPPGDAGPGSLEVVQLKALRSLLGDAVPAHSSLFSVIVEGAGQNAYLRASSKDYNLPSAPDGGVDPLAASYRMLSTAAALEGFNEQGYGVFK